MWFILTTGAATAQNAKVTVPFDGGFTQQQFRLISEPDSKRPVILDVYTKVVQQNGKFYVCGAFRASRFHANLRSRVHRAAFVSPDGTVLRRGLRHFGGLPARFDGTLMIHLAQQGLKDQLAAERRRVLDPKTAWGHPVFCHKLNRRAAKVTQITQSRIRIDGPFLEYRRQK